MNGVAILVGCANGVGRGSLGSVARLTALSASAKQTFGTRKVEGARFALLSDIVRNTATLKEGLQIFNAQLARATKWVLFGTLPGVTGSHTFLLGDMTEKIGASITKELGNDSGAGFVMLPSPSLFQWTV